MRWASSVATEWDSALASGTPVGLMAYDDVWSFKQGCCKERPARYNDGDMEVVFTDNGSKEWPAEAEQLGLPNPQTTPPAALTFNSHKAEAVFKVMDILNRKPSSTKGAF